MHIHSTASDGTDSPAQIVRLADDLGLEAIALTDHDTVDGLLEAQLVGQELGLEVIAGCELAARTPYGEMHIVGLWVNPEQSDFLELLAAQTKMRDERNREILALLSKLGIQIKIEELETGSGSVGRPHIARILCKRGFASSVSDAFKRYLGAGKRAYVPRKLMSPAEVLEVLKKNGATTVFAHPMSLPAPIEWVDNTLAVLGGDGLLDALEVYHPEHNQLKTATVMELVKKHHLLMSGGSDYHGKVKSNVSLGRGNGSLRVPAHFLDELKKKRG